MLKTVFGFCKKLPLYIACMHAYIYNIYIYILYIYQADVDNYKQSY